ncbi:putative cAMP-responsive element modulator [Scophthalmus maximus]|uniref:Putative cAMP-responsive element modulator n=1 Tax=Scophthalmus maximus TaxID=52904 RepID=A0A2U9CWF2_SCOMX|nr:putative cAMP-responsive element modulator [Scophthalmus maximus]
MAIEPKCMAETPLFLGSKHTELTTSHRPCAIDRETLLHRYIQPPPPPFALTARQETVLSVEHGQVSPTSRVIPTHRMGVDCEQAMKEEETCQPVPPVTSIPLHPQWFASQQNDPSLPFMAMAGPQTQQPLPGTSQYYSVVQNRMQHYGMPTLQGRPVQFQPDGTHNILLQTPHPTTSTTENRRDRLDQPQMNSKQTLSGSAGDFTAYQQHKASSSLPHGGAGAIAHSSKKPGEVVSHKRELRLQKNRNMSNA